jgi:uncharacterized membrane protein
MAAESGCLPLKVGEFTCMLLYFNSDKFDYEQKSTCIIIFFLQQYDINKKGQLLNGHSIGVINVYKKEESKH